MTNGGNIEINHKLRLDSLVVVPMTTGDMLPHKLSQSLSVVTAMITGNNIDKQTK